MLGAPSAGFVLAGGRSSRMGTDKALLEWQGQSFLSRAARVVREAAGSVTVVADPARYRGMIDAPVIADQFPGAGPLAGIHAALQHTTADWNLIVACDMPGLESRLLRELLGEARHNGHADILLPVCNGKPQPLCAVYRKQAVRSIEAALHDGRWKITDALASLPVVRIEMPNPTLFANINTPEEWRVGAL